jgi:hypothetical protein
VIPESACLVGNSEVIQEAVIGSNGALIDERRTVSPGRAVLKDAMPVLLSRNQLESRASIRKQPTMLVDLSIVAS